jgi:KaiC/GvpD/RAD55 family RecA-like ATPase
MPVEVQTTSVTKAHEAYFERTAEAESLLQGVIAKRKSMLLFGEAGSGKTRLLKTLAASQEHIAYTRISTSARELLTGILDGMQLKERKLELKARSKGTSLVSLRGIVERRLEEQPWILFLDQVQSPSNAISHLVKELNYYDRTPILFAASSEHMEDTGGLRPLCLNRTSRVGLKPWPAPVALEFTQQQAALSGLEAANLDEALKGIAELSHGYPGRILQMLRMASEETYRQAGSIKFHVLYVDYSMNGSSAIAKQAMPAS